jgi:hypothetical protein
MGSVLKYRSDSDKGCWWPSEPPARGGGQLEATTELKNSSEEDKFASIQLADIALGRWVVQRAVGRATQPSRHCKAAQLGQAGALLDQQL